MIKLEKKENKLYIYTPYNKEFVQAIKMLNSKWNGSAWITNVDLEEEVLNILKDVYGYGEEKVDVIVTFIEDIGIDETIEFAGRIILRRISRDRNVIIGDDCSVIAGSFSNTGGSVKHPAIGNIKKGTSILIRNFPKNRIEDVNLYKYNYETQTRDILVTKVEIKEKQKDRSKYLDYTFDQLTDMMKEIENELHKRMNNLKSQVMKKAWELYKDNKFETFSESLKESWRLSKEDK